MTIFLLIVSFFAAFFISLFTSIAGISGAFLLLPFQIGILDTAAPSVSATNQLYNVIACPAGIWKFLREGRLLLPLTLFMAAGTLPGVLLGAMARATVFRSADRFLVFAAFVLGYVGWRLLFAKDKNYKTDGECKVISFSLSEFSFEYGDTVYRLRAVKIMAISMIVGLIGGIYGIGGGGMIAPFLVSFFGLPVHAISGACLFTTFLTSFLGVFFYCLISPFFTGAPLMPDWIMGIVIGLGGMCGIYIGASVQKYISGRIIKIFLGLLQLGISVVFVLKSLY